MDDQDWYEKDLDDFAEPQSFNEQRSFRKEISKVEFNTNDDNPYPYDLWFLISMYVAPEEIGRFALICRQTNQIVNTTAFWISVYKKYNKLEAKRLTYLLRREHFSIVRTYVIRSLLKTYPFFQKHSHQNSAIQNDPHFLLSYRCIRIWHSLFLSGQRQFYNYYFEFSLNNIKQSEQISSQLTIFKTHHEYLTYKDSCILHAISSNYIPMNPYIGMKLSRIELHMSSDYRYYKLKMSFHSYEKFNRNHSTIIIDPILCLKIYKWYNIPSKIE